ncbi:hypothetical protein SAMN05444004_102197 [Jannaschia faecimaris]|uniref:Excalibur calcium-binding domain-containing protein n=1 Tax=Jannaschia faecimaris TaxID=1244108 RepID=A0A1H3LH61_9RHOB|nr:hypothetical protein [Jannaschia faecimaris]SDY63499.1 hypothetical protein SAMN05444004_102197 [Jannaschia faecimaris]
MQTTTMIIRGLGGLASVVLLAACQPTVPDSGARGAGFDSPSQVAQRREALLRGQTPLRPSATVRPPAPGSVFAGTSTTQPAPAASEAEDLANQTRIALGRPTTDSATGAGGPAALPDSSQTSAADLNLDRDNPTISSEQDFAAVSAQRDIEADAERLRAARQQYQLVTPTELQRPDSTGPNIFAYALGPAKPVGTQGAYRRGLRASENRAAANCQNYRSDDIAQEDFLASGGPERDRLGIDPDGDGNACGWDPAVVRRLVQSQ